MGKDPCSVMAIWMHHKEVVFKGRATSVRVEPNLGVFVLSWCRGACGVEGGPVWSNV